MVSVGLGVAFAGCAAGEARSDDPVRVRGASDVEALGRVPASRVEILDDASVAIRYTSGICGDHIPSLPKAIEVVYRPRSIVVRIDATVECGFDEEAMGADRGLSLRLDEPIADRVIKVNDTTYSGWS